jgi:hypothetical protein
MGDKPLKEGTFYFPHDYNARSDYKIKRLLAKHGVKGYGVFWAIVESLYNNANALPTDYDSIAYDLQCDKEIVESIVNDFDLFFVKGDYFMSNSVQSRLNERDKKSERAKKSAEIRWKDTDAKRSQCDSNAIKEKKGKENINILSSSSEEGAEEEKTPTDEVPVNIPEGKPKFQDTSIEMILSRELFRKIKQRNPKQKEPNFQTWCREIDRMIRIDHRSIADIQAVISWSQQDTFWQNNILSTAKLKEKFDQLTLKMESTKNGNNRKRNYKAPKGTITGEEYRQQLEDIYGEEGTDS